MKIRLNFLFYSLLVFLICLTAISLLTNVLMVNIVKQKLDPFGKYTFLGLKLSKSISLKWLTLPTQFRKTLRMSTN